MNKTNNAITLSHVTKSYILRHEKPTFVEKVMVNHVETFYAIRDISLVIPIGQRVGIIGPNGSGKTTLLKLIAGITSPNKGIVITTGNIVSLIDIEAGFHPDLTGEQNIYLNGMIIGMDRSEINRKYKDIVEFAQIGAFIDAPLYTYSAGMKYRLGFAIAVNAKPSILLLDEGISAGDIQFQRKFHKKIDELVSQKTTILAVTHWLEFVKKYCKRILIVKEGRIISDKPTLSINAYKRLTSQVGRATL